MRTPADCQSATSPERFRGTQVANLRYGRALPGEKSYCNCAISSYCTAKNLPFVVRHSEGGSPGEARSTLNAQLSTFNQLSLHPDAVEIRAGTHRIAVRKTRRAGPADEIALNGGQC